MDILDTLKPEIGCSVRKSIGSRSNKRGREVARRADEVSLGLWAEVNRSPVWGESRHVLCMSGVSKAPHYGCVLFSREKLISCWFSLKPKQMGNYVM